MLKRKLTLFFLCMGLLNSVLFANSVEKNFLPQEMILQVGKFYASFGKEQFVPIQGLVGDNFTITDGHDSNYFFGLGYFKELLHTDSMQVLVGLNGFYLAKTKVQGDVQQEQLFTNLSYHYYITQFPIYAAGKILFATPYDRCKVSFDMGLGPNIMVTSDFKETSLDGGETIPDKIFKGQTTAPFSATAGLGLRFNRVIGPVAVEIGYRFFYLGNGSLKNTNSEVVGDLDTGNSYANSFIVSLIA